MSPIIARPRLTTLIILSALAVLPVNMFLPSLPNIASDFSAEFPVVNLSIAGFAALAAAVQLVAGPLSDRYGRRPVVLVAVSIFVAASVACALASSIEAFLAFRFMQAAVAAAYVVSLAVIRDLHDERQSAATIGKVAMVWAVAPMLGPTIGGLLDQVFGWRASFVAFAVLGAAALALSAVDLAETRQRRSLSTVGQLRAYRSILSSSRFWAYALCIGFSTGTFYAFLGGAPLVAAGLLGGSTAVLGLYMGTITAGFVLGSFLAGRYATSYSLGAIVLVGPLVSCAGLVTGLILHGAGATHVAAFFGPCVFVGIGNGLTRPGATAGSMSVRADLAGTAAGLTAALAVAVGAMVSSATGVVLDETNPRFGLLAMMLASALLAMLAAACAVGLDRNSAAQHPDGPRPSVDPGKPRGAGPS